MKDKFIITKKSKLKGDDGFRTFSVRINNTTVERLEVIAAKTGRSRNEVISTLLQMALDNIEIKEEHTV